MKIGTHIKKLRNMRGWSQQVVADQLGMTQANYHKLESDKSKAKLEILEKVASLYDISILDLLVGEQNVFHIKNNTHNESVNGTLIRQEDPEKIQLLLQQLKDKEEIIKLKDENIPQLQKEIEKRKE